MSPIRTLQPLALALGLILAPALHAQTATTSHSASWWDPNDSGWGVATLDQGNVLGPYWFTYDEQGRPAWLMGIGRPQPDGSYAGDLYRFTGTPFQQIAGTPSSDDGTRVGTVRLEFDADPQKMRFTTTIEGQSVTRALTRFNFSGNDLVCKSTASATAAMTNYTDMWWEPASSGWGINVMHLGEKIYGQWYTYENPNKPVFMTLMLERQANGSYSGKVFRQKDGGRSFKSAANTSSEPGAEEVGSASLRFLDGVRAEFDYSAGNAQGHHVLQRLQFGNTANACEVKPYVTGGNGNGGGADAVTCHPPYRIGDSRKVHTISRNGANVEDSIYIETVTGPASFNGQSGYVMQYQYPSDTRPYALSYVGNGNGTTQSFGAEAFNPATGQLLSTSLNDPSKVELTRSFKVGETLLVKYAVNWSGQGVTGRTELETTYRLLGREQVTVPAGSFNACKFEITIDEKTNTAGVLTHSQHNGFSWMDADFGRLRQDLQGTSTVTVYGTTTTTEFSGGDELLEATMNGQHRP